MRDSKVVTVVVRKDDFERLIAKADKLDALEAAGVDNWSGYDYAMDLLEGEDEE